MKENEKNSEIKTKPNLFSVIAFPPVYLKSATFKSCHLANAVAQCSAASPLYVFVE